MKALRLNKGTLELAEIPLPPAGPEALIKVTKAGICGTDLELVRGYADFSGVTGHEFVGIVMQSPEDPSLVGRRVVGEINIGCDRCTGCISGDSRHCTARSVLGIVGCDGAHAEYLRLPSRNLHLVPDGVSDDQAVFTEPLAAAIAAADRTEISPETEVAVIGDGKLGLLCAMTMAQRSDKVVLIGKHHEKMSTIESLGISSIHVDEKNKFLKHFDVVVEASGSQSGFVTALDIVRPKGTIVLKSTFHGMMQWNASRTVVDEISIIGSRCGRFAPALAMLEAGAIPVERLIAARYPLERGVEAFRRASDRGVLKVLLEVS